MLLRHFFTFYYLRILFSLPALRPPSSPITANMAENRLNVGVAVERLMIWSLCLIYSPFTQAFLPSRISPMSIVHKRQPPLAEYIFQDGDEPFTNGGSESAVRLNNTSDGLYSSGDSSVDMDDDIDIVGGGTLGDIMSSSAVSDDTVNDRLGSSNYNNSLRDKETTQQPAVIAGLVTTEGGELNTRFQGCNFTPMERIALTANGNLQRIFSSFYDAPVHVHVDFCVRRDSCGEHKGKAQIGLNDANGLDSTTSNSAQNQHSDAVWDRVVHIYVHGKTFCKATSTIRVQSPVCVRLIEDGKVGLGQLFRYLNKLPTFSLLDAGRTESCSVSNEFHGGMWRTYELQCEEMTCLIHEEFHNDAWNILPTLSDDESLNQSH